MRPNRTECGLVERERLTSSAAGPSRPVLQPAVGAPPKRPIGRLRRPSCRRDCVLRHSLRPGSRQYSLPWPGRRMGA